MEIYRKLLEYEEMLKDGVISEAEFQKLKEILYSGKMTELGIQDEAEFEDYLKKDVFKEAILMLENNTVASYREAIFWLEKLGDWGNAASVIEECRPELLELEKQEELEKAEKAREELYDSALQKLSKKTLASHKEAINDLESLGDWRDAKDIVEKSKLELLDLEKKEEEKKQELERKKQKAKKGIIIAAIIVACLIAVYFINENVIKPNRQYKAAVELYEQGKYDEAISAFEALDGYKDSADQIQNCKLAKAEETYTKAKELYNSGRYEQALDLFKSISGYKDSKTQMQLCTDGINENTYQNALALLKEKKYKEAIDEFDKILLYKDSKALSDECKYNYANELKKAGKYEDAYNIYKNLGDYKDSVEQLEQMEVKVQVAAIINAPIGANVTFGAYEQDNNKANGKEAIEWRVLKKDKERVLLISNYVLDEHAVDEDKYASKTWIETDLSRWLNSTFTEKAFSEDELEMIDSNVDPSYDRVFLLSRKEAEEYFENNSDRVAEATEYCGGGPTIWFLRDVRKGSVYFGTDHVESTGKIPELGIAGFQSYGVRPAIWIKSN